MGSAAFWTGEALVMLGIAGLACVFAAVYAALEQVMPFLRGGLGRLR